MNNSVLLQKTIRDNNEDLTNFITSLKHWESDMKRKDAQLSSPSVSEEFLPPVRSKPRKEKSSKKKLETKNEKPKRISSFDYSKWEKFDVEKACEDIDNGVDIKDIAEESDDDEEQEIEKLRQQAIYEKELGNKYVKKEKWKEAIEQYTKAIKCFDKDAVFYANRALCYLKINKLNASEEDCNKSLQLDSSYVKAYQRRAAARTALKKYKEAEADFNSVLRLEPNNTQAKQDLEKLKVHLKPHNVKEQNKSMTEKLDSKKQSSLVESLKKPDDKYVALNELSEKESKTLPWEPVDPARIIKPVCKPPHIRSKKPLQRIEIIDVDDTTMKDVNFKALCLKKDVSEEKETNCIINKTVKSEDTLNSTNNVTPKEEVLEFTNMEKTSKLVKNQFITCGELESDIEIPPLPRTSVQFYNGWKKLKHNPDLLFKYLQKIDGSCLPTIFQDSLESDVFSSMINILSTEFVKYNLPVLNYIEGLLNIRRFEMLVLFMNKQDKEGINILLDYCLKNNDITNDDRLVLRERFKLSNF